jgi:hypothetical protein
MPPEDHRTQYLAIFLIVFAAACIFLGSRLGFRDLVNFAQVFGGGGVGILTGQKMQQLTDKNTGSITVNPTTASNPQVPEVK